MYAVLPICYSCSRLHHEFTANPQHLQQQKTTTFLTRQAPKTAIKKSLKNEKTTT
jgi:predicted dithiol-disulfide oxidoreductase (DUF899 family)